MKKVIAYFFVLLFLFHFTGFYVFIGVRLLSIHREARDKIKALPDDAFEKIELSATDFKKFQTEEDEISWHGKMYDIGKVKVNGDSLILYAIHDSAEDDLISFLNELIKRSEGDLSEEPSEILDFISLIFVSENLNFTFSYEIAERQTFFHGDSRYSVTLPIESPPPKG